MGEREPAVDVIDAVETGSRVRMRSARLRGLEEDDRPTVIPAEPVDAEALEARVLFEHRAVAERRLAAATQQDLQATRRMDAIDVDEMLRVSVDLTEIDQAFERRRSRVRVIALLMMFAVVVAIAFVAIRR